MYTDCTWFVDELIALSLADTNHISRLLVSAEHLIEFGWTVAGEGAVLMSAFIPIAPVQH